MTSNRHVPLVDVRPPWRWRFAVAGLAVLVSVTLGLLAWVLPVTARRGPRGPVGPSASPTAIATVSPTATPRATSTPSPTVIVVLPGSSPAPQRTRPPSDRPTHHPHSPPAPAASPTASPSRTCSLRHPLRCLPTQESS